MLLEVIATTTEDALIASANGANRIELITGFKEGGLTPSIGLIEQVAHQVSIPVQVMVRPHSRSFVYSKSDIATMVQDIKAIRQYGHKGIGIVVGVLTEAGLIDTYMLEHILDASQDLDVTFHRAFDEIADQEQAYEQLSNYSQIKRVLTSGGKPSVLQATDRIKRLVEMSKTSHVAILAGGGLHTNALTEFIQETGVKEIHLGTAVRGPMGEIDLVESDKMQSVRAILDQMV